MKTDTHEVYPITGNDQVHKTRWSGNQQRRVRRSPMVRVSRTNALNNLWITHQPGL